MVSSRGFWRRQWTTLVDGEFPWGAVIAAPSRYGASRQRLVVYPPGITSSDRRWLRAWRGFPLWGGLMWFVLYACFIQGAAPWTAMGISVGVCALAGATAFVKAAHTRGEVRTLDACVFAAVGDPELRKGQRRLRLLASTLCTADAHHHRGELSTVD
ncbi:DUF6611 family protein [Mycolicibacterium mengxianglii]|uniref:DUF6611 family protein n=1 Tax=Mycolicibacterium mengxianglii TaxID=2736649 RepID=UPI002FCB7A0C